MNSNKRIYYHQYINDYIYKKAIDEPDMVEGIKKYHSMVEGVLDAFEKLGYDVCFDYRTSFLFHGRIFRSSKILSFLRKAYRKVLGKIDGWFLNRMLRKKIEQFSPHYFYTELNSVVSLETLKFMRAKGIKSIEWFGIFPFNLDKKTVQIKTVSSYDVIVSPISILDFFDKSSKPRRFIEVHAAYNPKVFKKIKGPVKHIYDVVFVGGVSHIHSNRWDILEALFERYERFAIYGYGIKAIPEKYSFLNKYKGDIWSYEYADVLNRSRIVINLMLDSFRGLSSGVNQRTFEIAACGAFQLCEHTDNLKEFLVPGEDVETFKDRGEMIEKIDYYLKNERERERVALSGHKKVARYDYYNQMKYVFARVD